MKINCDFEFEYIADLQKAIMQLDFAIYNLQAVFMNTSLDSFLLINKAIKKKLQEGYRNGTEMQLKIQFD